MQRSWIRPILSTILAGIAYTLIAADPITSATTTWIAEPTAGIQPWLTAIAKTPPHSTIDWNAYLFTDTTLPKQGVKPPASAVGI